MPSLPWKVGTGLVALAVLLYMVVVAGSVFPGLLATLAVVIAGYLLSALAEEGYPPELGQKGTLLAIFLTVAIIGYSVIIAAQILLGVILASLVVASMYLVGYVHLHGYPDSLGRTRSLATALAVTLVLLYSVFVGGNLLLGIVASLLIGLTAWLTSPTGPLLTDS
jgi:hypothetical protein